MKSDISPGEIANRLTTGFIGRHLMYYPSVSSTMDVARKAAQEGACEGTTIVADEQTAGRGRLGRLWINPPGVLAVSIIFRPEFKQLLRLNMVASLAISRCVEKGLGLKPAIKWPNDVLINGKKVSGILTENAVNGEFVDWSIVGMGINVSFNPGEYAKIADTATSLRAETGREVSRLSILIDLLGEIELLYIALNRGEPIHEEWQSRLVTLGKMVRVRSGDRAEEGYAESVDCDGSLLLRRRDGTLARIVVGDVTLRA